MCGALAAPYAFSPAASVLVVVLTYRKGERITREPFEED